MPRRIDHLTQESFPLMGEKRRQVVAALHNVHEQIQDLDRQMHELARKRRELAGQLRQHRRRLWPRLSRVGRCPYPDGSVALPPVHHDAVGLWGRRLRARCLEVLREHAGALALPELHALLHHRGYLLHSATPVKTLADAMRYEVSLGNVRRVERGVYQAITNPTPTTTTASAA
ncbi:MAG: hypothetical protein AB7W59_07555 [Acidimicrobiia bacterium]